MWKHTRGIPIDSGEDYCQLCSRYFINYSALLDHMRSTNQHEWCERCDLALEDERDKYQHEEESDNHWICPGCSLDSLCEGNHLDHLINDHYTCTLCSSWVVCDTEEDYWQHMGRVHHACDRCDRRFNSRANLEAV